MSTTLYAHPPQPQHDEIRAPRLTSRQPTPLERLALRAGLLLITYGRRRYAVSPQAAEQARAERLRQRHDAHERRARLAREHDVARGELRTSLQFPL